MGSDGEGEALQEVGVGVTRVSPRAEEMELPLEKAPIWKWLSVLGGFTQQSTPWVPPVLQGLELALLFSPRIIRWLSGLF